MRLEPPHAGEGRTREGRKKKINPRRGVTMCDDAGESSVQASTPKVASTAGDRGTKTDASRENLVKRAVIQARLNWAVPATR